MNCNENNEALLSFVCTYRCPVIQQSAMTVLFEGKVVEITSHGVLLDGEDLSQIIEREYFSCIN